MINQTYMLDTNVFNHVVEGKISCEKLIGLNLEVTRVQLEEIRAIKSDPEKLKKLMSLFKLLIEEQKYSSIVITESFLWDVKGAGWNEANWVDKEKDIYSPMLDKLNKLNKNKPNNSKDIAIAFTSIRNHCILITADKDLFSVVTEFGGACANAYCL